MTRVMNAKVENEHSEALIVMFGVTELVEYAECLINVFAAAGMVVAGTWFQKKLFIWKHDSLDIRSMTDRTNVKRKIDETRCACDSAERVRRVEYQVII